MFRHMPRPYDALTDRKSHKCSISRKFLPCWPIAAAHTGPHADPCLVIPGIPANVWRQPMRATLVTALATLLALAGGLVTAGQAQAAAGPYTALGDSYSSGVGTRNYFADSGTCYRGPGAYPALVASRLGAPLTFVACSGAKVPDVLNQLGSLNASTAFVTVSVGGNDAGFASVITRCALPWPFTCTNEINNANNYIRATLPGALDNLYSQIR